MKPIHSTRSIAALGIVSGLLLAGANTSHAQLGSGWTLYSPTKKIHLDDEAGLQTFNWTSYKSVCSPICADYSYDSATDTETFRILDSRSNRSEIRLQNDYSSGRRQFQGYITFNSPLHDESLFQIFGNTGSGATFVMIRGYNYNGGEIRVMSGSHTIATGIYGVEVRLNIIHEHNSSAKFYVNGSLKHERAHNDPGAVNYHKYGCYGTTSGNVPAVVKWRAARSYRDGFPPSATLMYEAESLTILSNSPSTTILNDANCSGGQFIQVNGTQVGHYMTFRVPNVPEGTYSLRIGIKKYSNRAIVQTKNGKIGGAYSNFGSTFDEYSASAAYTEVNLGNWTVSTSDKMVGFHVTGKNASSSSYVIGVDYIKLIKQ